VRAILDADLILAGPGSLYTSVLPNLLIEDIRRALESSNALKIYVCNVATQPGETDHFSIEDHYEALTQHVGEGIFTLVLANGNYKVNFPAQSKSEMVHPREYEKPDFDLTLADLVDESQPWRHDPSKLAAQVLQRYQASKQS
jgi:uncharacterized cofD-like protein